MPHLHRFHIDPETPDGVPVTLSPEEAHHAARVVRVRVGYDVALFDGVGREILGKVAVCSKKEVVVEAESVRREPEPTPRLSLALAGLHRDKPVEFAIRHGTELGVRHFRFFRAARSERAPKRQDKWAKLAIDTCKQCGRLWLPDFSVADSLDELLEAVSGPLLIATADRPPVPWPAAAAGDALTLLIGPEGDFTEAELEDALAAGARPVSLGQAVYRAEVAAVVATTVIAYNAGKLGPRA